MSLPSFPKLRVAAAQTDSTLGSLDANLADHLRVIAEARSRGIDILLFPEMSLTGHSAGPDALRLAIGRNHPMVRQLAEAAGPMTVIFGVIEEDAGAQFYNSAFAVRNGGLLFVHRKLALATYGRLNDGKFFAPGKSLETLPLDEVWNAGVLICNDTWHPPLVHLVASHGATVLFAPISSAIEAVGEEFDNPGGWDLNLRFYAMTYGLPVIMANRVGKEGRLSFWGGSRIIDPFGKVLAQAGNGPELLVADLDYEQVRTARFLLPTIRDTNATIGTLLHETRRLADKLVQPGTPEVSR